MKTELTGEQCLLKVFTQIKSDAKKGQKNYKGLYSYKIR